MNRKLKPSFLKQQLGFTLIEVLVALVIVAAALPALLGLMSQQVDSMRDIRERTIAGWVAENQLTRLRLQNQMSGALLAEPVDGKIEMADRTWFWRIEPEQTAFGVMLLYRVTVINEENEEDVLALLETFLSE